jgi:hypothetical protein
VLMLKRAVLMHDREHRVSTRGVLWKAHDPRRSAIAEFQ